MSDQATINQQIVDEVNQQFMQDKITAEEAIILLTPVAKNVNDRARAIAKKYNMKPRLVKPEATKSHGAKLR